MLPGSCANPVTTCCDTLFEIADRLVQAAADAVEDCLGPALCPTPFPRYVSHGEPASVLADYVVGWVADVRPMPGTRAANPAVKQIFKPRLSVTSMIRLVETGHPNVEMSGTAITLPATADLNYAAEHSYSHAQRALAAMLGVSKDICALCDCDSITLVSMRPDGPLGGSPPLGTQVAWEWRFDASWS